MALVGGCGVVVGQGRAAAVVELGGVGEGSGGLEGGRGVWRALVMRGGVRGEVGSSLRW